MTILQSAAVALVQTLLILATAPFVVGVVRKVKARLQCRRGARLLQPYSDLAKLLKKGVVVSTTTSWIFTATPYVLFASTLAASLLVPTFLSRVPLSFAGDVITVVSLLTVGTFFLMLAGLDAGSAFGGMGSSREAIVFSLTEPAMMLSIFAVGLTAGSTNMSTIVHNTALLQGIVTDPPPHLMALAALFLVALAETGRVPVDNPATHLELTMIHEAMVLEYSGRHLAVLELAAALKLLLYISLIACIFVPWGLAPPGSGPAAYAIGAVSYVGKLLAGGFLLVLFETSIAKMRVFRVPEFLGAALMLGLLGTLLLFISRSF